MEFLFILLILPFLGWGYIITYLGLRIVDVEIPSIKIILYWIAVLIALFLYYFLLSLFFNLDLLVDSLFSLFQPGCSIF